ncbi:MAG: hypothetical protein JO215_12020, partial [Ktedonobacteraceae bacterium]|nr:hypothetical protein [Ktedonobacteraceae bacterium]
MSKNVYQPEQSAPEEKVSPVAGETKKEDIHIPEHETHEKTQEMRKISSAEATPPAEDISSEATQALSEADKTKQWPGVLVAETTQAALARINKEDIAKPTSPEGAKLPKRSRAAAAQRLGDVPYKASHGVSYEGSHHRLHASRWRLKRHWKR